MSDQIRRINITQCIESSRTFVCSFAVAFVSGRGRSGPPSAHPPVGVGTENAYWIATNEIQRVNELKLGLVAVGLPVDGMRLWCRIFVFFPNFDGFIGFAGDET